MSNTFHFSLPEGSAGGGLAAALRELAALPGEKVLELDKGVYTFDKAEAVKMVLPVSNTIEKSDRQTKSIGLCVENIDDLTIEGNGAKLLMTGDMSAIVLKNCRNITLKNLTVDYIRPRVSEMKVLQSDGNTAEFLIHADSRWQLDEKGRLCWVDADGNVEDFESWQVVQAASPGNTSNLRALFNPVREAVETQIMGEGKVRFSYSGPPPVEAGQTWQFRHPSRRENGVVIANCENVTLCGMELNFTPGLGIVAQMTRNISILHHRHAPAAGSGRVCAAHADCIQISSCRGKVEIADGFFSGAQDDPINIHGTYLKVEKISGREVELRFCQSETWGWMPFEAGDEVCFVRQKEICRTLFCRIAETVCVDGESVKVILDREVDEIQVKEGYVLENMSAYPDAEVRNCIFECYPTRGLLLTSAGKCRVHDNEFRQTAARSAIRISCDANSWFESGGVRDVEIFNNRFRFCQVAAIDIDPQVKEAGAGAVHRNIRIFGNSFENCSPVYLRYHFAADVSTDIPEEFIEPDFSANK